MPSSIEDLISENKDSSTKPNVKSDLESFNVSDDEIRSKMNEMNEKAKEDFN
mgnify:CR=1 FL=1